MTTALRRTGYTISHETLEEMRFTAIRLIRQGMRVEVIAQAMRLNRSTIFGWIRKFRTRGLTSLKSTKTSGAPPKLKQRQMLTLFDMLRRPAVVYGFSSDLWTGPRVRVLLKKKFRINFHVKYMPRFLARLGLVQKVPERRALEQDPKKVRRWKRFRLPKLQREAARCRGLILYGDEALFVLIPYIGKTWTFPEIKPIVRVSGKRGIHVGVTSAISDRGHLVFQLSKSNFNAKTLIRFMKALRNHFNGRKLFFVIDGAPSHRAKVVEQFASANSSWLRIERLPGYSPELNPDEKVWNYAKTKQLNARPLGDKKALQSAVVGALRSLQKRPDKICSFFEK